MKRAAGAPGQRPRLLRAGTSVESTALVVGACVFVLVGVVAWIVFWNRSLPISGSGSLGQFIGIAAAVASAVVFAGARIWLGRAAEREGGHGDAARLGLRVRWYDTVALAVAHGVIALLGWLGVASVFARGFSGAVVFAFSAAVLAAAAVAATAYAAFLSAVNLSPTSLSGILLVFLVVGTFASMLSATDPLWWKQNLSALGMSDDISALAFNLTLIIAGVLVTLLAHAVADALPVATAHEARGQRRVLGLLVLLGVLLACVGIFPVDRFLGIHNTVASGMAVVFVVLVVGLRWFVPTIPRVFLTLGYVFVGVVVVIAVLFVTGYYNLTAVELVAFLLIFSWLIVLLRTTGAMASRTAPETTSRLRASID